MMKTITAYRPMIFSGMAAHAQKRALARRQLLSNAKISLGYFAAGCWMIYDTDFAPWHWEFWLMFAPMVLGGELLLFALRSR